MKHFSLAAGIFALATSSMAQLVTLGFDTHGNSQIATMDPTNGNQSVLNNFAQGTGWSSGTFTCSSDGAYAITGTQHLYSFDPWTGAIRGVSTLSKSAQTIRVLGTGLVGIGFDNVTNENDFESIDAVTGNVTTLNEFTFSSGSWNTASFVADTANGLAYGISNDHKLYRFNALTGAILGSQPVLSNAPSTLGLGPNGLVGIANNIPGNDEFFVSIDPISGAETVLSEFNSGGFFGTTFVTDPAHNRAYIEGGGHQLLGFDATTGAIVSSPAITGNYVGFGVVPEPSPFIPLGCLSLLTVVGLRRKRTSLPS